MSESKIIMPARVALPLAVCASLLASQFAGMCGPIADALLQGINIANQQQQRDQANAAAQQQAQADADAAAAQQQADAAQQQAQAQAIAHQQTEMANQQVLDRGAYLFDDAEYGRVLLVLCNGFNGTWEGPLHFNALAYTGIKTTFTTREKLQFIVGAASRQDGWKFVVFNESGDIVRKDVNSAPSEGFLMQFSPLDKNTFLPGQYSLGAYIGDTLLRKVGFTITGDAQEPGKQSTAKASLPKGAYDFQDDKSGHIIIVTCNYYQNFEGDNVVHCPEDFVGIKNYFSTSEKKTIYMASNIKSSGWSYKLWDSNGDLVDHRESTGESYGINTSYLPPGHAGSYTAAFYNGDSLIKKISFIVVNDQTYEPQSPAQAASTRPPTEQPKSADGALPKGVYNFTDSQYGYVIMLTCNSYQNVEGDNAPHYPSDFNGVKDTFSPNEKVGVYLFTGVTQTGYGMRIWDGSGNLINDYVAKVATGGVSANYPRLAPGNYAAAFYHDGMQIKKIHFTVTN